MRSGRKEFFDYKGQNEKSIEYARHCPTLKRQTAPDAIETMHKIFSTAKIEKPANENYLQTFEVLDENGNLVDENVVAEVSQDTALDNADDLSVFKKAKEKMSWLSLKMLDEYFEYLDFQEHL